MTEKFRNNEDPYVGIASRFYGGQFQKTMLTSEVLASRPSYRAAMAAVRSSSKQLLNLVFMDLQFILILTESDRFVRLYRDTHWHVVKYWEDCRESDPAPLCGPRVRLGADARQGHRIYLPNGAPLIYDTLEWHVPEHEEVIKNGDSRGYWRYKTRNGWDKLYGAKLVEQTTQALARIIFSQAMIRIKRHGLSHGDDIAR